MPRHRSLSDVPVATGSNYPAPFNTPCMDRSRQRLGNPFGLSQFGVNLTRLPPGSWSAQRHWHSQEDEFVYVMEGELILVTDAGEETLGPGDFVGFPAGVRDGHHLQNRSDRDAVYFEVGARNEADSGEYPDIDLVFGPGRYAGAGVYRHKDGTPY